MAAPLATLLALVVLGATAGSTPVSASTPVAQPASGGSVVAAAPPTPPRYRPEEGAKFNVPRSGGEPMFRLEEQVLGAIRHAHRGSIIRFAMFSFDRFPVADALIAAKHRGVSVQVLVNDHEVTKAQRLLRAKLGTNRHHRSWIYQCSNGCRSKGENLHDKFYLFSHTGAARWVVMTGSINMKLNGHKNQYNDLWTRNDDQAYFDGMNALFERLKRDRLDQPTYWTQDIGPIQVIATPFPRYDRRTDPIMRVLRPVSCWGAEGGTGSHGRTVIRVVMHSWGSTRGAYLAHRMRALYEQGCDIRLLYGFAGALVRHELARPTGRGRIPIRSTGYDTNADEELDLYTHQKDLFISGHYGDDHAARIVVTGSSNWTVGGMQGDELIVVVKGLGALPAYRADFEWLWNHRSHSVHWSPTRGHNFVPAPTGGALTRAELARLAPLVEPRLPRGPSD